VTGATGEFDSGIIQGGRSFNHTFIQPGIYDYYSDLHPYMTGKVIVGFNLYNLQIYNRTFEIPFLITGNGNELQEIDMQSTSPTLQIRMRTDSAGYMTVVIPKELLNIILQFGKNRLVMYGDKNVNYNEISDTPYSKTFKINFGSGVNYVRIADSEVFNQTIKSDVRMPIPNNVSKVDLELTIPRGASEQGRIPFDPPILRVNAGDRIIVMNNDLVPHSVTSGVGPQDSNSGLFFDTSMIQAGNHIDISTSKLAAGQYDFFCIVHPFMKGKIQVLAKNLTLSTQAEKTIRTPETIEPLSQQQKTIVKPLPLPPTMPPSSQQPGASSPPHDIINNTRPTTGIQTELSPPIKIVKGSSDPAVGKFYEPGAITIKPRTKVTWVNDDDTLHTVTSGRPGGTSGKDFDSGYLGAGSSFEHTFDTPGTFDYWCTLHPHMTGQVVVR
jgi:plastocyanin